MGEKANKTRIPNHYISWPLYCVRFRCAAICLHKIKEDVDERVEYESDEALNSLRTDSFACFTYFLVLLLKTETCHAYNLFIHSCAFFCLRILHSLVTNWKSMPVFDSSCKNWIRL